MIYLMEAVYVRVNSYSFNWNFSMRFRCGQYDGEYIFTSENSEAVEWSIYILDEAFDDSLKYIKQVSEPVLRGDGTIFIDKGKYVYVYCSANEFTTGIVDEKAKLKITHCPLLD